jgi:alpha-N-arabinofuranosidase
LKVEARGDTYSFSSAAGSDEWIPLQDNVDARFLSTKVAGGFVWCVYALYATSLGSPSENTVYVEWFEYVGDDDIYK